MLQAVLLGGVAHIQVGPAAGVAACGPLGVSSAGAGTQLQLLQKGVRSLPLPQLAGPAPASAPAPAVAIPCSRCTMRRQTCRGAERLWMQTSPEIRPQTWRAPRSEGGRLGRWRCGGRVPT